MLCRQSDELNTPEVVHIKSVIKKFRLPPFRKIRHVLPIINWLPKYQWRESLLPDVISGLTVGIMAVPQGVSRF